MNSQPPTSPSSPPPATSPPAYTRELSGPTNAIATKAGGTAGRSFGNKFSSTLKTIGKATAFGLAGAAVIVGKVLFDSIGAAEESLKVSKQTEAVIASTGGAARVTARGMDTLVGATLPKGRH